MNDHHNTIKRSPLPILLPSKSTKTKKKDQQSTHENIDTNNNTLKSKGDDNTLKSKQDKTTMSTLSNGIPSVPRVHMGAGFMKIFNECPLEIHASYCWINNETRGKTQDVLQQSINVIAFWTSEQSNNTIKIELLSTIAL